MANWIALTNISIICDFYQGVYTSEIAFYFESQLGCYSFAN